MKIVSFEPKLHKVVTDAGELVACFGSSREARKYIDLYQSEEDQVTDWTGADPETFAPQHVVDYVLGPENVGRVVTVAVANAVLDLSDSDWNNPDSWLWLAAVNAETANAATTINPPPRREPKPKETQEPDMQTPTTHHHSQTVVTS